MEKFEAWIGLAPPTRFCVRLRAGYVRPAILERSAMIINVYYRVPTVRSGQEIWMRALPEIVEQHQIARLRFSGRRSRGYLPTSNAGPPPQGPLPVCLLRWESASIATPWSYRL